MFFSLSLDFSSKSTLLSRILCTHRATYINFYLCDVSACMHSLIHTLTMHILHVSSWHWHQTRHSLTHSPFKYSDARIYHPDFYAEIKFRSMNATRAQPLDSLLILDSNLVSVCSFLLRFLFWCNMCETQFPFWPCDVNFW